jgi:hypothetical protein
MNRSAKMASTAQATRSAGRALRHLGAMVAAMGLAVGISGPAHAANIVVNGGFETGDFTGWVQFGNSGLSGFSGVQCPGPSSTVAEGNCSAFFGPLGSDGGIAQGLNTLAGHFYNISFDFLSDGGTPSDFSAFWGPVQLISLTNPAASAFRPLTFLALATASNTTLSFNFRDDPGFLFLDAVSVAVVPEPGTMALLGIGMAGLWWRRRKVQ